MYTRTSLDLHACTYYHMASMELQAQNHTSCAYKVVLANGNGCGLLRQRGKGSCLLHVMSMRYVFQISCFRIPPCLLRAVLRDSIARRCAGPCPPVANVLT